MNPFLYTEMMQYRCNVDGFLRRRFYFRRMLTQFTAIKRGARSNSKELLDVLHTRLAKTVEYRNSVGT